PLSSSPPTAPSELSLLSLHDALPISAPMSRMEARRAAKAAKDSPAVVASRVVGEVFISLGVLMLLFVTYQLWWTNIRAEQIAGKDRKSTRLNSSHVKISYAVFCLKKK